MDEQQLPLEHYDQVYHIMSRHPSSSLTRAFFSYHNLHALNEQIGVETSARIGFRVKVIPNDEFYGYLEQTAKDAPVTGDPEGDLQRINSVVLEHEVGVQFRSLQRRALFYKWYINKERPLVLAPPVDTHGRHYTEGSAGIYGITDPAGKEFVRFRAQQERLQNNSKR